MTLQNIYNQITRVLVPLYGLREAAAVASRLLDELYGFTKLYRLLNGKEEISEDLTEDILTKAGKLATGIPVGYITGNQEFMGRDFSVNPDVLIPRGETEELVQLVVLENDMEPQLRIVDMGTGSGAIAVSLALELPRAEVEAWDISTRALETACRNAEALSADIKLREIDILNLEPVRPTWDIIVSNPPYVCQSEKELMHRNVIEHEPHEALFVSDDDPLLFYRSIAQYAIGALKPEGKIYLEINERFGKQVAKLLESQGFRDVRIIKDIHSKERIVAAIKAAVKGKSGS